jgi:hypothetical protein
LLIEDKKITEIIMSEVSKSEKKQLEYPKPLGWEWMTDEERLAALQAEPKPETEEGKIALRSARYKARSAAFAEEQAIRGARMAPLLSECPRCSITLDGPPTLSLSNEGYSFKTTVQYEADPKDQNRSFVFDGKSTFLSRKAPRSGYYSVYPSEECKPEERIEFQHHYPLMRRARGPTGRFLEFFEIDNLDGWEELAPKASVTKEIHLEPKHFSRDATKFLEVGKTYWLRYDRNMSSPLVKMSGFGISRTWRYGTLEVNQLSPFGIVDSEFSSQDKY